jgi:hypothetical protein
LRGWSEKLTQIRTVRGLAVAGWTLAAVTVPFRPLSATPALPVAAQQQLVQQYCRGCHNYDDYAGGVEGNSNQRLHYDTPAVLVGGASGRLQGDRHLAYASRTVPTGTLMLSILGMFDVRAERFGDSTRPLQNI